MKQDSNEPTRAEYIDVVLANEISEATDKPKKSTIKVKDYLKFLKKIRREFVKWDFIDDYELREHRKREDPKFIPNKPGNKGTTRMTKQNSRFLEFRKEYPRTKDYSIFEDWCNMQKPPVPKEQRYRDEESFRERLKREKIGVKLITLRTVS